MRASEARLRVSLDLQEQHIRLVAGQVVDDVLGDLIDDLNLSGDESSGLAAARLERVRTLHRARFTSAPDPEPQDTVADKLECTCSRRPDLRKYHDVACPAYVPHEEVRRG